MQYTYELIVLLGTYFLLFLLFAIVVYKNADTLTAERVVNGNWRLLHLRHCGGIIIMIVLPIFLLNAAQKSLLLWPGRISGFQFLAFSLTVLLLVCLVIKNGKDIHVDLKENIPYASCQIGLHLLFRTSFLIAYEIFFRGFLLFTCIKYFGTAMAVSANIVLYALIHLLNGKKEFWGSIPFGLLLCLFTIWCESLWPAIVLHVCLSSAHDFFILTTLYRKKSKLVV